MRYYDYTLSDECRTKLRKLFNNLHEDVFDDLAWRISQAIIQFDQSKSYHSMYHEKPSEHVRRLKSFKKHANGLKEWISKESEYQDHMFFGCDFLDSVDNDEAVVVRIANTRNALDHILYHELKNADRAIATIEEIAKEPRITPAFFRRELVSDLVSSYESAFRYLPSVYWDDAFNGETSELCPQGKFIDFAEIVLQEAGETIGRHSIYNDARRVIAEHKKSLQEQDWRHLL